MRFAHLSDLHLSIPPEPGAEQDSAYVAQMVRDIRRISEVLDFVIVSGDMTKHADLESFWELRGIFDTLNLPVYMVPGNHDGPANYYRAIESCETLSSWNIASRMITLPGLRLLGIDTSIEGETTGRVDPKVMPLVTRAVEERGAPPLVVIMHHPPIPPGLRDFDETARLEGADQLLELLLAAETAPVILSGHVHRPYQASRQGVTCFVAGSPTYAYTSNLPFGNSPVHFHGRQDFYFVHEIDDTGRHVVTPQSVSISKS